MEERPANSMRQVEYEDICKDSAFGPLAYPEDGEGLPVVRNSITGEYFEVLLNQGGVLAPCWYGHENYKDIGDFLDNAPPLMKKCFCCGEQFDSRRPTCVVEDGAAHIHDEYRVRP